MTMMVLIVEAAKGRSKKNHATMSNVAMIRMYNWGMIMIMIVILILITTKRRKDEPYGGNITMLN